jgi:hypothetical protein
MSDADACFDEGMKHMEWEAVVDARAGVASTGLK